MGDGLVGGIRDISRFSLNTPVPHAGRPSIERYRVSFLSTKRAIQRIQRLMGFNGVLTDGAGGSAQTDLSNLIGPAACERAGLCRRTRVCQDRRWVLIILGGVRARASVWSDRTRF